MDVAVIGVTFSRDESELPRAYVVRRPGSGDNLTEDDVKLYSSQRLAKYKNLDGGVRFVASLPKNTLGKTLKKVLKEEAAAEFATAKCKIYYSPWVINSYHVSVRECPDYDPVV